MMLFYLMPLVMLTALLNAAAQLILKTGMSNIGSFSFKASNIMPIAVKVMYSPFILSGIVIYVISLILWLLVLSRMPVNIAYPMGSLAYIFNALGAYYFLHESLSYAQMSGIFMIVFGVFLLTQH